MASVDVNSGRTRGFFSAMSSLQEIAGDEGVLLAVFRHRAAYTKRDEQIKHRDSLGYLVEYSDIGSKYLKQLGDGTKAV